MARVTVFVERVEVDGDWGVVDGVRVTCSRCQGSEECVGESDASILRAIALLRDGCPSQERNLYVPDEAS